MRGDFILNSGYLLNGFADDFFGVVFGGLDF